MSPDSVAPPPCIEFYSTVSSGVDLYTALASISKGGEKSPARQIQIGGAGTIVLKCAGSVGNTSTINAWPGLVITGQIMAIISGTATDVLVQW